MTPEKNQRSIQQLIQQCRQESRRFQAGLPHDERACLALFRLAVVENNQAAWTAIYTQYRSLLQSWVHKYPNIHRFSEPADVFVSAAFQKFWKAMSPEKLSQFHNLGALLKYLRACLYSVITDELRRQQRKAYEISTWDETNEVAEHRPSPEAWLISQTRVDALEWILKQLVQNEAEEIVMTFSWFYGLPPREIQEKHPHLFKTFRQVYQIKRNLIKRLRRHPEFKKLFGDRD